MDSGICQTSTASPAERGGLPTDSVMSRVMVDDVILRGRLYPHNKQNVVPPSRPG